MPYIPEETIDEISARADLVNIVLGYVPTLKQAGARWKGCCPFHQEKTPSFIVNPDTNMFHCFGCGVGGNVFKFVMMIENLDFPGAAQLLARKYNVIIPEPTPVHRSGNISKESGYNLRERLFLLHEKLAAMYVSNLKNNPDSKAAEYFRSRQIEPGFALKFMIGSSPDSWDATMNWALKEGFTLEELKQAHLVSERQKSPGNYIDFFRNRLMFPIWNEQGRVVGFSARQIDKEQGGGKYVNSVESPIFKKGRLLYGLNFARPDIPKKGSVILCEGQMDVIAMHCSGCTNAVAPQGTAFGQDQASVLRRYTDTVLLATDSDSAGMAAVLKDAAILLPMGFHLKVVTFPGGKDPDELLHNSGPEAVQKAVAEAADFFEFLYSASASRFDSSTPEGKIRIAHELLKYIRLSDSDIVRDSYFNWLAGKLGLSPVALEKEMHRLNKAQSAPLRKREVVQQNVDTKKPAQDLPDSMSDRMLNMAMLELLEVALRNSACAEKVARELSPEYLDDGPVAIALAVVAQAFLDHEPEQAGRHIASALVSCEYDYSAVSALLAKEITGSNMELDLKVAADCLKMIRRNRLKKQVEEIRRQLLSIPAGEDRTEVLREFMRMTSELSKL
ncbi:MAG: DNA primase [Lentisphaeria bacterium]|nr:DNA primase [Lentisphaeria bacterium]